MDRNDESDVVVPVCGQRDVTNTESPFVLRKEHTYNGAKKPVRFRMVSVDFSSVQVDEIQTPRGRMPVRAFAEFQVWRNAFYVGQLIKESKTFI